MKHPLKKKNENDNKDFLVMRKTISHKENEEKVPFILKYAASAAAKHLIAAILANSRFKHSKIRFTCRKMMHFILISFFLQQAKKYNPYGKKNPNKTNNFKHI